MLQNTLTMKVNWSIKLIAAVSLMTAVMAGCKKEDAVTIPPAIATFQGQTSGNFFVQDNPNSVFSIPIGVSTVSDKDRTINFTVSSPTGAQAGQQYNLSSTSVVIPAGKAVGTIDVKGLFAGFAGGRKDTLVFTLTSGDVAAAEFNDTYKLVMQKYCDVDLSAFSGTYVAQDYDDQGAASGPPYEVEISPGSASGTAGAIAIAGLWGVPDPVTVNLNWADPANFTTTIPDQDWFFYPYYQSTVKIRGISTGNFSSCDDVVVIRYEAYIPGLGSFGVYSTKFTR